MKKFNLSTMAMSILLIATLFSCDNDIDNLGSDIVGVDPNEVILSSEIDKRPKPSSN